MFKLILPVFYVFLLKLSLGLPSSAASKNFGILKSMLQNRDHEAKVYIPDRALIGSKIEIVIDAPGASKVSLFKANTNGTSMYEGVELKLGSDFDKFAETNSSHGNFSFELPLEQYGELVGQNIYFDAIAYYDEPTESKKSAIFFGANAAFSNVNAVKVIAPKKDNAAAKALLRSIAPGLLNRPAQY